MWRSSVHRMLQASTTSRKLPCCVSSRRLLSGSITYSGGQATEGQGGYYGSGGARVLPHDSATASGRSMMLALAQDVEKIQSVMTELEVLENLLRSEEETAQGSVTGKSIELKANIKKLMTAADVLESLNRLEVQGEPVWGLSTEEREMIVTAREKVNEC
ncbi:predicted protein [Phaeodactylum tricornutum CCAP 1055/1]|uniref:Uncharacterized protein n=2 Tax=Phaeodactylum tricornutum TaxID=2850 RepID=B7FZM6_PHATC|nr:predicted protein [Phaeodactylum tricornutum CCAP 1055/1]EEC48164.1 predicted protein [Phaeodactylum tricornutum CCAP 1055/1]|eukprot:XP_002179973.1 predicted protein [Phaeodactylum tricornutum CCAP 1055/1]